jgi:large subunit ribosomal protein L2
LADFFFYTKYKNSFTKTISGSAALSGLKRFSRIFLCKIYQNGFFFTNLYVIGHQFLKFPLRQIMLVSDLYGNKKFLLGVEACYPGSRLYYSYFFYTNKLFPAQLAILDIIPIGGNICQIYNLLINRVSFVKSSGSKAIKDREFTKVKIVGVKMPSGILKFFSPYTVCVFSSVTNLFLNKNVDGKWGFSNFSKKRIIVRGVAMNPVDHPNGGRTKAKQPELSPWG